MRLDNLVYNRMGNSFSALFSSPSFQIMEKVNAQIEVENRIYNYQIAGISCIEEQDNIFKIHINLNQKDIFLNFKSDGRIILNVDNYSYEMIYEDDYFRFPIDDFNLIVLLSMRNLSYFSFEKDENYFVKIFLENNFIQGIVEFLILSQQV